MRDQLSLLTLQSCTPHDTGEARCDWLKHKTETECREYIEIIHSLDFVRQKWSNARENLWECNRSAEDFIFMEILNLSIFKF